jgi:perosamine synthetase
MIPIIKPLTGEAETAAARRVILGGWIAQGPEVVAFEREFAELVGARHACAVSNCTAALHLALLAIGVGSGDEVITVSHSFIATANAIRYCGAQPVFVDIEASGHNIDPTEIEKKLSPRTRAILCVHQMGMPCDLGSIVEIGHRRSLPVIEDAACAIGSEILWRGDWERIGRPHGDIACFSFHPRKIVSTGDGGMITTSEDSWDAKFRLLRQHGMSISDTVRHGSNLVLFETYPATGYNYRMTDIQAAVGREQLKRLRNIVESRRALAGRYRAILEDINGLELPTEPDWARTNWQSYCVRLPQNCDQRAVMQSMLDCGVSTRRGVMCSHREAAYADLERQAPLTRSERAQDRCIVLPLYGQMTAAEQDYVADALRRACAMRSAVPACG